MARLNEPPVAPAPSTEAYDAIKRKFLRTNRELAKYVYCVSKAHGEMLILNRINSQQQVHIRQLENDRSRLVAENCSLAQQVLHLQNMLEAQDHAPSFSSIDKVKNQLEAKIQELGGLVEELGQLNQRGGSVPCNVKTATKKTSEEKQWRSALGLQEVENAMLPTIAEYKAYPRMTMKYVHALSGIAHCASNIIPYSGQQLINYSAEELQDILDAPESQSPDIGPPPVSHFNVEEPIAFKHIATVDEHPDVAVDGNEVVLPMNIEPRRKRRESGPRIRRMSLFESPEEEPEEQPEEKPGEGPEAAPEKTIRTGAKRKFSVQEDDNSKSQAQAESFQFSRRGTPATCDNEITDDDRPLLLSRPALSSSTYTLMKLATVRLIIFQNLSTPILWFHPRNNGHQPLRSLRSLASPKRRKQVVLARLLLAACSQTSSPKKPPNPSLPPKSILNLCFQRLPLQKQSSLRPPPSLPRLEPSLRTRPLQVTSAP